MTSWRRRTHGSSRQIGKPFPVFERQKLPKLIVPVRRSSLGEHRSIPPTLKKVIDIPLQKLEPREKRPVDVESRVNWFIGQYKSGHPWAPIWVFKHDGKYVVYDGNARLRAAQALGLKSLQANVMGIAQKRRVLEELRVPPKI